MRIRFLFVIRLLFFGFLINAAEPRNLIIINDGDCERQVSRACSIDLVNALYARNAIILVLNVALCNIKETFWRSINDQWDVFNVNNGFSLFIPKKFFEFGEPDEMKMKRLGLNVLPYLGTLNASLSQQLIRQTMAHLDSAIADHTIDALLKAVARENRTPWNIVLSGHGSPENAGMPPEIAGFFSVGVFRQFLQTLNQFVINSLVYAS